MARVLVIDDDDYFRRATRRLLSSRGFDVIEAGDGEQGIEFLKKHRGSVGLVLLDLVMPGLAGFDVASELRADPATSQIPNATSPTVTRGLAARAAPTLPWVKATAAWVPPQVGQGRVVTRLNMQVGPGMDTYCDRASAR